MMNPNFLKGLLIICLIFSGSSVASSASQSNQNILSQFTVNKYHPIVFGLLNFETGLFTELKVLGGINKNRWCEVTDFSLSKNGRKMEAQEFLNNYNSNPVEIDTDLIKGNESFKMFSGEKPVNIITINQKPKFFVSAASAQATLTVAIKPFRCGDNFLVGINGEWNPAPRLQRTLQKGKEFAVDIDGDGKEERLSLHESSADQSVIFQMEKDGKTIILEKALACSVKDCRLLTLDLNGDGKLEIITRVSGCAGGINVYRWNGSTVTRVLSFDDGE